ncbi:autotransporter assembly complex family protein [Aquisalimonas sp.]|uniref:autotransporter assembly complex protein TamA n=1 Tax=Aquisalimonas sp. TaxID=1872621 RepID=UPI0025C422DC|nr:autotransporter assembly complex family protein [Aquisalimonas sp.]
MQLTAGTSQPTARRLMGGMWLMLVMVLLPVSAQAAVTVEIRGVEGELADNIRNHVGTPASSDPLVVRRFAGRVNQRALEALQALGHYEAEVQVDTRRDGDSRKIVIEVDPGPPVVLSKVDVRFSGDAANDQAFQRLLERMPLREGDTLHHGRYSSTKRNIENLALTRGYFDGRFERARVNVNIREQRAEVILHYAAGERYRFGDVEFSDKTLSEDLLHRLVPFDTDDYYHSDGIAALNRNLLNSDYFRDVRVRTREDRAEDKRMPVAANVRMSRRNRVGVGVGFATDVGPRLRLDWRRPWVNADGHSVASEAELSEVRQSVSSTYSIPLTPPLDHKLQFQGGWQREEIEDTEAEKLTAAIQRQRLLTKGWTQTLFLRWEREKFVQASDRGETTLTLPGMSLARTRSRGGIDPNWGDRQFASVAVTDPELGSDIRLSHIRLGTKWLRTFARHRVVARLDGGAVITDDFSRTPPSLRFFTGGDQSVRGFSYQSLAPRDDNDELLGGRYLAVGSIEYGYRFLERWTAATFYDVGNAFNDLDEGFREGAGVGVRWASPVGPIRLDLAWGISEPDNPFRIHFSMGPEI